jgi:hypothetical protein
MNEWLERRCGCRQYPYGQMVGYGFLREEMPATSDTRCVGLAVLLEHVPSWVITRNRQLVQIPADYFISCFIDGYGITGLGWIYPPTNTSV